MTITLAEIYNNYVQENINSKQKISNINTSLIRYTLPKFGFTIPQRSKKRFYPDDIKLAIKFIGQLNISEDLVTNLSKYQDEILKSSGLTLTNQRQQKKNLKKLIDFIYCKFDSDFTKKKRSETNRLQKIIIDNSHTEESKVKRKQKETIALSFNSKKYPGNPKDNQKELDRIQIELEGFYNFLCSIQNSDYSHDSSQRPIILLLGWMYKKTNSLKEVSLFNLIPVYDIYPDISEYNDPLQYYIQEGIRSKKAKEEAKKVINFIDNFFIEYQINTKNTKNFYINGLINLCKYLYKDITDDEEYESYEDISVIRKLKIYKNKIPLDNKKIQKSLPTWDTIIKVLCELKRRADIEKDTSMNRKSKLRISKHLQRFLILGFFTLVPPSRQRVIRELEIGKTLKHGLFKNGVFVDKNNLENKKEAKYYIHLQPENYKTGNKYGEWLAEFPNVQFQDGTYFYEYLNKWIYQGFRDELMQNNKAVHNYLFSRDRKPQSLNGSDMKGKIKNIFYSTTKQKISPHQLRKIYRTYLQDIGASKQVLNSSAFWMRHSPEIASKVYTKQTLDNKLRPGRDAIAAINSKLIFS